MSGFLVWPKRPACRRGEVASVALAAAPLLAAALLAAGCTASPVSTVASHAAAHGTPSAKVTITSGNVAFGPGTSVAQLKPVDKRPDLGIRVSVADGRLASVVAAATTGHTVRGALGPGGTTWQTSGPLRGGQHYRVTATAVNAQGRKTVTAGTFTTQPPQGTFSASTTLVDGQTYGVGMPIMITFSRSIRDKDEVEHALQISASKPVAGAWYWMNNSEVWFRPRTYWPAHTEVRFDARLRGIRGAPGVYGSADLTGHFRVGNSLIVVASTATHYMKVWYNGRFKGKWPISTGQPGDDTPDGHYLSFDMGNPVDMNSASYGVMPGDPGYYNVWVYDSVKFTYSGDYVHSAPWSVAEQGVTNVSHGCVNVGPANAAWYYDHSVFGDPISVVGSPVKGAWGDGWTIYFLSWRKLLAGSGAHQAVEVGPQGSHWVSSQSLTATTPATVHPHHVAP
jgi:lipoprotein-anchoring transpeptidase ErfK/SrfK